MLLSGTHGNDDRGNQELHSVFVAELAPNWPSIGPLRVQIAPCRNPLCGPIPDSWYPKLLVPPNLPSPIVNSVEAHSSIGSANRRTEAPIGVSNEPMAVHVPDFDADRGYLDDRIRPGDKMPLGKGCLEPPQDALGDAYGHRLRRRELLITIIPGCSGGIDAEWSCGRARSKVTKGLGATINACRVPDRRHHEGTAASERCGTVPVRHSLVRSVCCPGTGPIEP